MRSYIWSGNIDKTHRCCLQRVEELIQNTFLPLLSLAVDEGVLGVFFRCGFTTAIIRSASEGTSGACKLYWKIGE